MCPEALMVRPDLMPTYIFKRFFSLTLILILCASQVREQVRFVFDCVHTFTNDFCVKIG